MLNDYRTAGEPQTVCLEYAKFGAMIKHWALVSVAFIFGADARVFFVLENCSVALTSFHRKQQA